LSDRVAMTLVQEEPARIARNRDAIAAVVAALTAQFGNRLVTSQAVREQHANTTTWIENQAPDAVVFPQTTADVQAIVRAANQLSYALAGSRSAATPLREKPHSSRYSGRNGRARRPIYW